MQECLRQGVLPFDLDHPYLKTQLIAYIGNKRSLQPLLYQVFVRLCGAWGDAVGHGHGAGAARGVIGGRRTAANRSAGKAPVFLDPFAGSGAVARLARYLGYRVLANDWEYYAYVLNYAHLCVSSSAVRRLFRSRGGAEGVLADLNTLPEPLPADRYIARYYAPASTEHADYRSERLFYTRENALIIDAVRGRIEELYPGLVGGASPSGEVSPSAEATPTTQTDAAGEAGGAALKEKMILLASLLYQCATHTNTSGVFKACHKGFGGHGRDALGRIMSSIRLQMPVTIDSPEYAEIGCQDALQFVRSRPADLCYLDPPYNQHQYGSNYHLLNTIALWDKPEVDNTLREDGRLRHKAGIRRDWTKTRSAFCYRRSAGRALQQLLEAIDARHIILSYNTEGIIPFEELVELLAAQGRVELFGNEYVKYRGGKQSIGRQVHNLEFVLVLDRSRSRSAANRSSLERAVLANRLAVVMKRSFCPEKVRKSFSLELDAFDLLPVRLNGRSVDLPMPHLYRFSPEAAGMIAVAAGKAGLEDLQQLLEKLKHCECADRLEEIRVLLKILQSSSVPGGGDEREDHQKRILWLLRKFAHRKYRERFERTLEELRTFGRSDPQRFATLIRGLEGLTSLARVRFQG
ncbi:MAG: DNA adenine methylase [Spirochaetaceae bacterium]|nr:MAG: DNA adenine methylase [Spirochaetaceae bacterium]